MLLLYLESHTLVPSFTSTPHPAASSSSISKPTPSHESEAAGGRALDPRIGRDAAVYVGQLKGLQGRLLEIGRNTGKIECPGRHPPNYTTMLKHLVLMWVFHIVNLINIDKMHRDKPTHNLAGTKLDTPYVGRNLMRPEPSLPRALTPPPLDELPELTS